MMLTLNYSYWMGELATSNKHGFAVWRKVELEMIAGAANSLQSSMRYRDPQVREKLSVKDKARFTRQANAADEHALMLSRVAGIYRAGWEQADYWLRRYDTTYTGRPPYQCLGCKTAMWANRFCKPCIQAGKHMDHSESHSDL